MSEDELFETWWIGTMEGRMSRSKYLARKAWKAATSIENQRLARILEDIRLRLKGLPESQLDGPNGLAVATMRSLEAVDRMRRRWRDKWQYQRENAECLMRQEFDTAAELADMQGENGRLRTAAGEALDNIARALDGIQDQENPCDGMERAADALRGVLNGDKQ